MLKINNDLLIEVGLGSLPDGEKNSFLKHIYETLEMRVGVRLADQMTNQQLDEFEQYFEAKDDAGAFQWLETNFPNYKDIVQQEFDKLKAEVTQTAPQILAASQAQAANGSAPMSSQSAPAPAPTWDQSMQQQSPPPFQSPQPPMPPQQAAQPYYPPPYPPEQPPAGTMPPSTPPQGY